MDPSGEGWLLGFCDGVDLPGIGGCWYDVTVLLGSKWEHTPFLWRVMGLYPLCRKLFSGKQVLLLLSSASSCSFASIFI